MKKTLIFYIYIISIITAFPQLSERNFKSLGKSEGLSNSMTTCIVQDTTGFIWIGTQDGLNRFDGYTIKIYKHIDNDTTSLPDNYIRNLYIDPEGIMWIGTNAGICRYEVEYDEFSTIEPNINTSEYEQLIVTDISGYTKDKIFFCNGNTLFYFNKSDNYIRQYLRVETGEIISFLFDESNQLWIGTTHDGGLYHFDENGNLLKRYLYKKDNKNSISANSIFDIAYFNKKIWIGTTGGGINALNLETGEINRYPYSNEYESYINQIYIDKDEQLWTCGYTGLKIYNEAIGQFIPFSVISDEDFTIKLSVTAIFQDKQGNYWTLHAPGGIGLSTVGKGFESYNDKNRDWSLTTPNVSAIAEDDIGNLWLANPFNGIEVFYWDTGKKKSFNWDPKNPYSLGGGATLALYRDIEKMWIGTNHGGLQYFEPAKNRFISYKNNPEDPLSIANNDIRSIAIDHDRNIWVCVHGKGIDKLDVKTNTFTHYNEKNSNLSNNWTFDVIQTQDKDIWVATAWELCRLEYGSQNFTSYYSVQNDTFSLSDNLITDLYEDSKYNLWVGTNKGLNLFNNETNNFKRISGLLKNQTICNILDDEKGNIWVSTKNGLYQLNPENGKCKRYDESDGLLSNEFNYRSGLKNKKGELHFGSIKGFNKFNPDKLVINIQKPPVVFTALKIFNNEVSYKTDPSILSKHISMADHIVLKHEQNVITIDFVALNMIHPEKNMYKYKMEGFDENWHPATYKREATYTNLDPGEYIFKVIASNNDGIWNEEGASIKITITPPWWMTWGFKAVVSVIVISLFIGFYLIRTNQIRLQRLILAKTVRERTKELNEKNSQLNEQTQNLMHANALLEERQKQILKQTEELKAKSDELLKANHELLKLNNTKDRMFSIIGHDLTSPFNIIIGFSEAFAKGIAGISKDRQIKMATSIYNASRQAYSLLQNLLNWSKSQTNQIKYSPEKLNLEYVLQDAISLFSLKIEEKNLHVNLIIERGTFVYADENMTKTVIRNLLNNAIKFTPAGGAIIISSQENANSITITISDNGIGMAQEILDSLFDLNSSLSRESTDGEKGSGLGLILCNEFIQINGGKLIVESEKGKGSTFSFNLPRA
ncbi:MAG: hypothetical protein JXB49_19230 [Bacteroidales bacterium]|nr:hypothetical protein [Bacteroidales bacterium]